MADDTEHKHRPPPDSYASQFETSSALSEWRTWLFALLGVSAMLALAYVKDANSADPAAIQWLNVGFYGMIAGFGVATIYKSYKDVLFLDRETRLASQQVQLLSDLNDVSAFLGQAPKSVFRSHIESLYTIFLAHSNIQQDNLIEVLHSRLLARNRVAELFASILITLGLVGTIVGLIVMMADLKTAVASGSLPSGKELISLLLGEGGALGGLDTAFYTTLLGAMFGGVILRILTSVVDAGIMRYTAHLAELTEVNVLPVMRNMAAQLEASGYYKRQLQ